MTFEEIKKSGKTVQLRLVGLDGNAFALMSAFQSQAKREKWTPEEIKVVLDECRSSNYDHLLTTLTTVCESPMPEPGEFDDEEN